MLWASRSSPSVGGHYENSRSHRCALGEQAGPGARARVARAMSETDSSAVDRALAKATDRLVFNRGLARYLRAYLVAQKPDPLENRPRLES
jgi:hypothetical protein